MSDALNLKVQKIKLITCTYHDFNEVIQIILDKN